MPGSRRLRISPAARIDLRDIYRYSARSWSLPQADRYLRLLDTTIRGLRDGRSIGRPVPLLDGILAVAAGTHLVFYRQSDRTIDVIRVLHQSMDFGRHL